MKKYDCVIIGAGPAGMTAGIYLARKFIKTLLITKDIGGQAAVSGEVDNFPGMPDSNGLELSMKIKSHLDKFKDMVEVVPGKSVKTFTGTFLKFTITLEGGEKYETKSIIIASGSVPRKLGIPGEKEFLRKGVAYCATCDAPLFAEKNVAVIGGGNSGLEAVIELNKIAKQVYLVTNGESLTGDEIYSKQIKGFGKVEVICNTTPIKVAGESFVESLKIENLKTKEVRELKVDGVFIEIGYLPAINFLPKKLKLNSKNEIEVDELGQTSLPGVFAAGDVAGRFGKQSIIAAGDGARAALGVAQVLNHLK